MRGKRKKSRLRIASLGNDVSDYGSGIRFPVRDSGCVLLVDDDAIIRTVISAMLDELGYRVLTAVNGAEAVDVFRRNRDAIDLVLLDMIMPVMNGADCFYRLKEIKPDVRVLMVSAFADGADIDKLIADGMLGYLAKPYRSVELERLLTDFFHH